MPRVCLIPKNDVLCVLSTSHGKSFVFYLIPALMFARAKFEQNTGSSLWSMNMSMATTIVIVVSPLNALISNQIARLCSSGIRATVLGVKHVVDEDTENLFECDFRLCDEEKLHSGYYHIVFSHPESFISCKYGRQLLKSKTYQDNIRAIADLPTSHAKESGGLLKNMIQNKDTQKDWGKSITSPCFDSSKVDAYLVQL